MGKVKIMTEKNNQNKKTYTEREVVAILKDVKKELDVVVRMITESDYWKSRHNIKKIVDAENT